MTTQTIYGNSGLARGLRSMRSRHLKKPPVVHLSSAGSCTRLGSRRGSIARVEMVGRGLVILLVK